MNTTSSRTKRMKKMKSVKIDFNYRVYKGEELIADNKTKLSLSEDEIKGVASIMEKNGGYSVDMCELGSLYHRVMDIARSDAHDRLFPDVDSFEDYSVRLYDSMPFQLSLAAHEYIRYKDVDQNFYLDVDGKETCSSFLVRITQHAFSKMVEVAASGNHDQADFDILKEYAPEAYKETAELINEWAYKYSIREYGEPKRCLLKEFPYQVYKNL